MMTRPDLPATSSPPPEHGGPDEPPPLLGAWSRHYALVVVELIAVIALCGWLSRWR